MEVRRMGFLMLALSVMLLFNAGSVEGASVKEMLLSKLQGNYTIKAVSVGFSTDYFTPVGGSFYSPMSGYATYGVAYDPLTRRTLVDVYSFAKDTELRCLRNPFILAEAWKWIIDYTGECN